MTKPIKFVRVMCFFAVIIVVNTGGLRVEVKRRENVALLDDTSGLKCFNKVTLYEEWSNCENRTRGIIIYCSPKEKENGCKENNSSTFSIYSTPTVSSTHGSQMGSNNNKKPVWGPNG